MRDRSYEAKVRVLRERPLVPEMVIGVRDILGTGIWEGEYAVASKGLGSFDISVGLGWGRLASRNPIENPLSTLDQAFDRRPGGRESGGKFGGESRSQSYFRGPAAWFGGARYLFTRWPMQIVAEYNSDDYAREVAFNTMTASPWNFALEWRPQSNLTIAASWLHGSSMGFRFSSALDTKATPQRKKGRAFYSAAEPRSLSGAPEILDLDAWYDRILYDAERSGLRLNKAIDKGKANVSLEVENVGYGLTADAVHKAWRGRSTFAKKIKSVEVALREEDHLAPTMQCRRQQRSSNNGKMQAPRQETIFGPQRSYENTSQQANRVTVNQPRINIRLLTSARICRRGCSLWTQMHRLLNSFTRNCLPRLLWRHI